MKRIKKITSILLSALMLMSFAVGVSAASEAAASYHHHGALLYFRRRNNDDIRGYTTATGWNT